ncbi:MAG: hypothetical protein CMN32_04000 [Saprospirales bacterium]|nr:hypothetical protein [Saprospirales bacterium]
MKKLVVTLLSFVMVVMALNAQIEPSKALSKAGKALSSYNLDPSSNKAKLDEALELIEIAANSPETNGSFKTWNTRGEIYDALASVDFNQLIIDQTHVPAHPESAFTAVESFQKAYELAQKKYEFKDALKGLASAASKLNIFANSYIQQKKYGEAFKALELVYTVNNFLKEQGKDPVVNDEELDNHVFVMAFCAQLSGDKESAKKYYKQLYDAGTQEATVYAQYFNLLNEEGDPNALEVLEKGRKMFPDNTEILFAEINYYIKQEKFDVLEIKLIEATEREPDNPSVYSALGNVYMNLFQQEFETNGDTELAGKYFNDALKYFNKSLELNPKQFDALYSIGSMYYNKAVILVKQANELPLSETKKYNELVEKSNELMNEALPYFKKAESINPNDTNTLIALKEIFARQENFDLVKEFTTRLDNVKNGVENTESYFKM